MSDPSNTKPDIAPPLLGEENLPTGTIAWVGFGSLALFAAGIYVAYLLLGNWTLQNQIRGPAVIPEPVQKRDAELGIVDQQLFELEHREKDERAALVQRLNSYGWVDKDKKVVHIPIQEAMRQVVSEQKK